MYDNLLANVPTDLWIGGKWKKASDGGRFDVIDPATRYFVQTLMEMVRMNSWLVCVDRGPGKVSFIIRQ